MTKEKVAPKFEEVLKSKGVKLGCPRSTDLHAEKIIALREERKTPGQIVEETKMPKSSVWRIIQSAKSRNFWLCPKRRLTFELNLTFQKRMICYADVFKCIS